MNSIFHVFNVVGILICRHCITITNFDIWLTILISSGSHSFQSLIFRIYTSFANKILDINDNKCFEVFLLPSWRLQFNNATTCTATLIFFTDKFKFTWIVLWTEDQKMMQTCWITWKSIIKQALCEFASEIQDVLMKDQAFYFITQLRNRYREILAEKGLDNAFSHRSDRL